MGNVYYQTLILVLTICLGQFLHQIGIFSKDDARTISKIMMNVTLPCVVIKNLNGVSLDMDILAAALIGVAVNLLFFLQSLIFSRAGDPEDRVVKIFSFSSFNIGSYAIPILSTFISSQAMAGVLAFNYPGTALFTYGVAPTAAGMVYGSGEKHGLRMLRENLLHNVPTVTCLVMLLMAIFHIVLPASVAGIFASISSANSTLAMLSIGILLDLKLPKKDALQCVGIIGIRLAAASLCAAILYLLIPISDELKRALMLVVFAPIASCNPILALHCGYQGSRVAIINSMFLLTSVFSMSILTFLLY